MLTILVDGNINAEYPSYDRGISLHNYTFESAWENKGSATEFDNDGWYKLMANAMKMDKVINVHTAIMDRYDPEKKIDLIVDEWGNWFDVEIGTNPGFLYQQNTMRDVISGMLILHVSTSTTTVLRWLTLHRW